MRPAPSSDPFPGAAREVGRCQCKAGAGENRLDRLGHHQAFPFTPEHLVLSQRSPEDQPGYPAGDQRFFMPCGRVEVERPIPAHLRGDRGKGTPLETLPCDLRA